MRDLGGHESDRRPPHPGGQDSHDNVRRGRFGTNGHVHSTAPGQRVDPFATDEDGAVDLVELQADDELINALSSGLGVSGPGRVGYDSDDRLVSMLASWKADVDSEPIPELVEPDVAVQMLQPARPSRRVSYLRPLAAAVAVAACAMGAVSIGAHEAVPGDTLWGVSKVLYTERAEQVQAASDLRSGIEQVNAKLAAGDTAGAQRDLAALGPLLGKVPGEDLAYFSQQSQFLNAKVAETAPGQPTDPAAPLRNGTQAPQPPATEGSKAPAPAQEPGKGPSSPTDSSAGSGTEPGPGPGPGPGAGTATSPGNGDPRSLRGPEGGDPGSTTPETSPTTSTEPAPTTEGSVDPTTGPTTRPTASGEGTADSTTSSSSTSAVSSTPN